MSTYQGEFVSFWHEYSALTAAVTRRLFSELAAHPVALWGRFATCGGFVIRLLGLAAVHHGQFGLRFARRQAD